MTEEDFGLELFMLTDKFEEAVTNARIEFTKAYIELVNRRLAEKEPE